MTTRQRTIVLYATLGWFLGQLVVVLVWGVTLDATLWVVPCAVLGVLIGVDFMRPEPVRARPPNPFLDRETGPDWVDRHADPSLIERGKRW